MVLGNGTQIRSSGYQGGSDSNQIPDIMMNLIFVRQGTGGEETI